MLMALSLFTYFYSLLSQLLLSISNLFCTDKTLVVFTSQHNPEPKRQGRPYQKQATRDPNSGLGTQQALGKLKIKLCTEKLICYSTLEHIFFIKVIMSMTFHFHNSETLELLSVLTTERLSEPGDFVQGILLFFSIFSGCEADFR